MTHKVFAPARIGPHRPAASDFRDLAGFLLLAFLFSFAALVPVMTGPRLVRVGIGWPTHVPALFGPALAAIVVVAATQGLRGTGLLLRRAARWRASRVAWLVALSPLLATGLVVGVEAAVGATTPSLSGFGRFSGMPSGLAVTSVLLVAGALGEEIGWRGFALPRLQQRVGPLNASLLLALPWFAWHVPLFFVVASYRQFPPAGYAGLLFGLACGSVILTWLYNHAGHSVLLCALWHAGYNFASATDAASGAVAAVVTTLVTAAAIILVVRERRAIASGGLSILEPGCTP